MRTIARLLPLVCLALSVSGCPSEGGGGGGPFRGFATAGLSRDPDFGDSFEGSAVFLASGIKVPDPAEVADGTCRDELQDAGQGSFQDAGDTVDLVTAGGTLTLEALIPGIYINFGGGDASLWSMGGTVSLEAPGGGGVSQFSRDFTFSGGMTLTSPDPAANLDIDRTQDLVLAWTSSGSTDPIFVTIEQYDFDADETTFYLSCKFDDDGSATLTPAQLLDMSTDANLDTSLSVSKERLTTIEDIPGLGGDFIGTGSVSYNLTATSVQ